MNKRTAKAVENHCLSFNQEIQQESLAIFGTKRVKLNCYWLNWVHSKQAEQSLWAWGLLSLVRKNPYPQQDTRDCARHHAIVNTVDETHRNILADSWLMAIVVLLYWLVPFSALPVTAWWMQIATWCIFQLMPLVAISPQCASLILYCLQRQTERN